MDVSRRRTGVKTSVAAGSVLESRMKVDEMKGGAKVLNGVEDNPEEVTDNSCSSGRPVKKTGVNVGVSGKRKTLKSEGKNCEEKCRELSVSVDGGIKRSQIQSRKVRSQGGKELSLSVDGIDKSLMQAKKGRSEVSVDGSEKSPIEVKKVKVEGNKEMGVSGLVSGNEKSTIQVEKGRSDVVGETGSQLRKPKSDSVKVTNQSGKDVAVDDGNERNSIQSEVEKSEPEKVLDVSDGSAESINGVIEKNPIDNEEIGSEETCKEFGVCQENVISSSECETNEAKVLMSIHGDDDDDDRDNVIIDEDLEEDEEDIDEEVETEIEKRSIDIKEMNIIQEEKPKEVETSLQEEKPKRIEVSVTEQKSNKRVEVNPTEQKPKRTEVSAAEQKPNKRVEVNATDQKPKRIVHQFNNRAAPPTSSTVNKQPPPALRRATIYQNLSKPTSTPVVNQCQSVPGTSHGKLQNLVDLVMWRDMSRSAFVFGIGTFTIISSSYTKDLNVSFVSVISYLGLAYLALIFFYRSLICRGVVDMEDTNYVVGEEEAVWVMKLVLPYLNECLLKIRALFSGDPFTTMKMAVLLFVFARCGSSITIWKMAKLGFFGVFTVPKVCSSYSTQLTAYGNFWIRRFRDAWDSCAHKKAVALAVFTLVWNLSSNVARIWAVFMMFVAVRYYRGTLPGDWVEDEIGVEETWQEDDGGQKQGGGPTLVELNKAKKES